MNKKLTIALVIIEVILLVAIIVLVINKDAIFGSKKTTDEPLILKETEGVTVVPTMNDEITQDSSWCGSFQLVWNDLKNKYIKKDIEFTPQLDVVKNLNKEDFNESMLSEDYYYKTCGRMNRSLKTQIEKGIQDKFGQTSDILDMFQWPEDDEITPGVDKYFLYTMLYRKFEYLKPFDTLENDKFGKNYYDVKYFGIDDNTKKEVRNQVTVLYYNSTADFAVSIKTKTNDEVIFCLGTDGNTFNDIYNSMNEKKNSYTGNTKLDKQDMFKAPNIEINEIKTYDELANKKFTDINGNDWMIMKAIQSIKFSLDNKGGEIKSEAGMEVNGELAMIPEPARYFFVDSAFTLFLREEGKDKPYFATRVDDITKFQN